MSEMVQSAIATPSQPPVHRAETDSFYRTAIERLVGEMEKNLDEEFSLKQMADVAIMSPFHLNRVFKEVTGVPPCRFLTALRLASAKRLLLESEMSVTDVSLEVGYSSLGTFTRRFAELVGLAPSHFRRLSRQDAGAAVDCLRRGRARGGGFAAEGPAAGRIEAPDGFDGLIFVGLFEGAVPQTEPEACALVTRPGSYRLPTLPDGEYHLLGLGLSWSSDPRDYLLYENALRAGSTERSVVVSGGRLIGDTDLVLRESLPTDPPILLALPLLLARRMASKRSEASPGRDSGRIGGGPGR